MYVTQVSRFGLCGDLSADSIFLKKTNSREPDVLLLSDSLNLLIDRIMYAKSESEARQAFRGLKEQMGNDAERSIACLEKDLESLLVHFKFEQKLWRVLRTTNPIERINKELKRRFKSMEHVGEKTQNVLQDY